MAIENNADNCDYFKTSAKRFWSTLLEEILLPVFLLPIVIVLWIVILCTAFWPLAVVIESLAVLFTGTAMSGAMFVPIFSTRPQALLWLLFSGVLAISEIFLVLYGPRFFLGMYTCAKRKMFSSR